MVYLTFQAVQNTDFFKKNFVYEKNSQTIVCSFTSFFY